MVEDWAASQGCAKPAYASDGSTIRDWSHLLLSRGEFKAALEATPLSACAGLAETVTHYVYEHSDLNRVPYEDIVASLQLLPDMEIMQVRLMPWLPSPLAAVQHDGVEHPVTCEPNAPESLATLVSRRCLRQLMQG